MTDGQVFFHLDLGAYIDRGLSLSKQSILIVLGSLHSLHVLLFGLLNAFSLQIKHLHRLALESGFNAASLVFEILSLVFLKCKLFLPSFQVTLLLVSDLIVLVLHYRDSTSRDAKKVTVVTTSRNNGKVLLSRKLLLAW